MLNFKKVSLAIFGFISAITVAWGQAASSPFSYLGIGETYGNALTHNQGMAGVGVSNPQYYFLNNQNPALLVFNRFTVFEAGFIGERRTVKGNGITETNGNGNLNYLATAFPVKYGKWSTSIGLMPYSSVNYKLDYVDSIEGSTTNTVNVEETGEGGINQFFWSNGVVLNKDFSIGLKASYLFGSIIRQYSNALTTSNQPTPYYPTIYVRNYVKDLNFTAGVSFHKDSLGGKKNYKINIGAVYDFKADLNTEYYARIERQSSSGLVDSTTVVNSIKGNITVPSSFSVGVSVAKGDFWVIGADVTYLDYRNFKDFSGETQPWGAEGLRLSLGTEFTPDPTALGGYLKRLTYRTGVSYDKYPYLINGSMVKDFGINFGLSLPVSRISSLDLAVKVGKRGNLQDNTIEEDYFKIYFGMTFNDQWFIKRRFD
jgi:hypothetical protein